MAHIAAINVYPVKACRGIALDRARVLATGFEHDREWLIVTPEDRFLTQRDDPRLALIGTALTEGALELSVPDGAKISVPLDMTGDGREVTIWRDRCAAYDAGAHAATFLSDFLKRAVRLVRFDPAGRRVSSPEWTRGAEGLSKFADAFAWLIISEASLADLNSRLPAALPMNRFRPNIVLGGVNAFDEDRVHEFVADGVRLRAVKPCTRCVVTTTDQASGTRDGDEPLRTLRQFRFDRQLKGVTFGQNLILIAGSGRELRVGQSLALDLKAPALNA
jgi:uncharacterized protein YcbX